MVGGNLNHHQYKVKHKFRIYSHLKKRMAMPPQTTVTTAMMAIGNHEFDWGIDALEKLAERANFPFLGVNILNQETSQRADFAGDYCIINRGKAKIGIIGSIGSDLESDISASVLKGYEFVNEYDMVSQIAKSLKFEENCFSWFKIQQL